MQQNRADFIIRSIRKFIRRSTPKKAIKTLKKLHPADLADVFDKLPFEEGKSLFLTVCKHNAALGADILKEIKKENILEWIDSLERVNLRIVLEELEADEAVEILSYLSEEKREKLLGELSSQTRGELEKLFTYEPETAGRIMIPDFFALTPDTTCEEAVNALRDFSQKGTQEMEMVFYLYVVDKDNVLRGVLSIRQLIINPPGTVLKDIMTKDVVSVTAGEDREIVGRKVARYDLVAIPVVDKENRMLGIVTVDDVMDVMREEATEDFFKFAGMYEEEILSKSVSQSVKRRLPWLIFSLLGGIMDYFVIGMFENTISQLAILAAFMPVILNMGGNVGAQSATIVVRGIATGKVKLKKWGKTVFKEIRTAGLMGIIYGLVLGVAVDFFEGHSIYLGLVIGFSLFLSMSIAAVAGAGLPILFDKMEIDPAIATGPLVATTVDVVGVYAYLAIATVVLIPVA